MKRIKLDNVSIQKREDKNFNTYYIVVNDYDQNEAFFCFEKAVQKG